MMQLWSFGNLKNNVSVNNLSLEKLTQKILSALSNGELDSDILVWTSGWSDWKKFTDVEIVYKEVERLKKPKQNEAPPALRPPTQSIPPLPSSKPSEKININSLTTKQTIKDSHKQNHKPSVKNIHPIQKSPLQEEAPKNSRVLLKNELVEEKGKDSKQRRKHQRVFARFKCIIRSTSLTFRTFTEDISLGGVSLEDEIPSDMIGSECLIYINSTKTNKNLKFKIALTERSVAKYFSFQDADESILKELSIWLEAHSKYRMVS